MQSQSNNPIQRYQNDPGLISLVECQSDGSIIYKQGKESDTAAMVTSSFLQLAQMLGKVSGLGLPKKVTIYTEAEIAEFHTHGDHQIGVQRHI